ncbi:hypothetical protein K6U06_00815 [Acidiferrimicrobium sp. IK]|uniref:hypothetical protein n=1 Tax=Acidiferrimicrobium sp. IK TaxID=2871700 RepID=UPI0021CB765A|nr:hypothetical protein [Acidiferrimicrobium sp. IK]MCU4182888.1 hypothetical protein [Acidiferrimicrobium sp. IK]
MELKAGSRWRSAVCDTEVIAVRAPSGPVTLSCGGAEMAAHGAEAPAGALLDGAWSNRTVLGKRYTDPSGTLELLCTKGGAGSLAVDGVALALKDAKPLPSSD